MGAFGVARLARQSMMEKGAVKSKFHGLDVESRKVTLRKETCDLCQNDCSITFAEIEGVEGVPPPSWGYMCGRDPAEQKVRKSPHDRLLRLRQRFWREAGAGVKVADTARVIGIPQSLIMYTYYPMWQRFFNTLGFKVQLSGQTTDEIRELGPRMAGADFCFDPGRGRFRIRSSRQEHAGQRGNHRYHRVPVRAGNRCCFAHGPDDEPSGRVSHADPARRHAHA